MSNGEDKRDIDISNSCHIFVTDSKLIDHKAHFDKADHFKIMCTPDLSTGSCLEFPKEAFYIVNLVQNMYKLQNSTNDQQLNRNIRRNYDDLQPVANSPQPSASSNSDSGIGFRDDCGNISDRILVVEFPAQQHLPIITSNTKRPSAIDASSTLLENLDIPLDNLNNSNIRYNYDINTITNAHDDLKENRNNINNIRAYDTSTKSISDKADIPKKHTDQEFTNRLTVRAMPNPRFTLNEEFFKNGDIDTGQIYSERGIDVIEVSPSKKSFESISMHSTNEELSDCKSSIDNVSVHSSKSLELNTFKGIFKTPSTKYLENKKSIKRHLKLVGSCDNLVTNYESSLLHYKLSPKVYGISKPNYSCEELNMLDGAGKCGYGSLQDLCSLAQQNGTTRNIAQSEPDVRLQRRQTDSVFLVSSLFLSKLALLTLKLGCIIPTI